MVVSRERVELYGCLSLEKSKKVLVRGEPESRREDRAGE